MSANPILIWIKKLGAKLLGGGSRRSRRGQTGGAGKPAILTLQPRLEFLEERLVPTTWLINTTTDTTTGTGTTGALRYAINNSVAGDTITFQSGLGVITLASASGPLTVSHNLTIAGQGPGSTLISGGNAVRVFAIAAVSVTITNLTIENGTVSGDGGGIYNTGNLTLVSDTISNNAQTGASSGGGVFNAANGTLMLSNSTVTDNSAALYGAGIANNGSMTISNSTITNNTANSSAGGIENYGGSLTVSNSTIANNHALLTGGGFSNYSGSMTLTNDTIIGNTGQRGGGVGVFEGSVTLTNDTICGNSGTQLGGGIWVNGPGATTTVQNTIVATNSATVGPDVSGNLVFAANDMIGNTTGVTFTNSANIYNPTYLGLSSLGNYGGPTQTIALLPGSPAIDAGNNSYVTLSTDQRGDTRIANGTVDIGAYESQGFTLAIVGGNNQSPALSTTSSPLVVTVTPNNAGDPVNGGHVTFNVTPAAGGGSGTLATSPATITSGQASVTPTSNAIGGTWTVTASTSDSNSVAFTVKNTPVVNINTTSLAGTATTLTITGSGFATTPVDDSVSFDHNVTGSITGVTSTSLTVSLTGLGTATGSPVLHATVTVDGAPSSSTEVATISAGPPSVTPVTTSVGASSSTITIIGNGFSPTGSSDSVTFDQGAVAGSIVSASATQLVVSLATLPTALGALHAVVSVGAFSSGSQVEVANIVWDSVVTHSTPDSASVLGTLRYAITNVQPGVPITFAPALSSSTIVLTSALTITQNVTITGLGASSLAISGNNTVQDIVVNSGITASISSLSIDNGKAIGSVGAGIDNNGNLTLNNITMSGNSQSGSNGSYSSGGAIFNDVGATLALSNATLTGNSGLYGGGLANLGYATINNTTISNNTAGSTAGGLVNYGGTLTLSNSIVSNNNIAVNANGGGIVNYSNTNAAVMTLINDTIYSNTAESGGGIYLYSGTATLVNDTVVGNSGTLEAGGIGVGRGAQIILENTIVAGNSAHLNVAFPDIAGDGFLVPINMADNDMIGTSSGYTITAGTSNIVAPTFLGLSTLGSYGGTTPTIALLPGSPAIDAGNNSYVTLSTDQRGDTRIVNGTVDIGAFESDGFVITATGGNNQSAALGAAYNPLVVSVTPNNPGEPVNGGVVTFAVTPAAGGGAAALSASHATISSGQASVTPTANSTGGTYTVTASALGATSATFSEKNIPTVTTNTTSLSVTTTVVTITGTGFATTSADDKVTFNDGVTGTVIGATSTTLTVSVSGFSSVVGGSAVYAAVVVDSAASSSAQVLTAVPVVTSSTASLVASSSSMTIAGFGFDTNTANDIVAFSNGVSGKVTAASGSSLTVSLTGLSSVPASTVLTAGVTVDGAYNGSFVPVATVAPGIPASPVVTVSTGNIADSTSTITITGSGFSPTATNDSVTFSQGVVMGTFVTATATQLIVSVASAPTNTGVLTAVVTVSGVSSGPAVEIGIIVWDSVVTRSTPDDVSEVGTLRYALANVQTGVPITFEPTLTGSTITLSGSTLTIGQNVTITGLGAGSLAVSGGGAVEDIVVKSGVTATITGLTIENGKVTGNGAGVDNLGNLTLTNDVISGNTEIGTDSSSGGGIYNGTTGTLNLSNSTVTGNSAQYYAGGIANLGSLTVTNSSISSNTASSSAGGMLNYGGTVTLSNSTFAYNLAVDNELDGGGGIVNYDYTTTALMTLVNDTIYGNTAQSGGGITNYSGSMTLISDIIAGNSARYSGGGIKAWPGALTMLEDTIVAGNSVGGNTVAGAGPDIDGTISTANSILLSSSNGASILGAAIIVSSNPRLSSLGNYGGPTQTVALLPGSPAIDSGDNALITSSTDQRGDARIVNGTVDIGAFESQGFVVAIVSGNNQSTTVGNSFNPLVVSVTANNPVEPVNGGLLRYNVTPASGGASGTVAATATISGGQATVTPTANSTAGTWTVAASSSGTSMATFSETNTPTVTGNTGSIYDSSSTITINGIGFSTSTGSDSVSFNLGVAGYVSYATATQLTVTVTSAPTALGNLMAVVTVGGAPATAIQVATEVAGGTWTVTDSSAGTGNFTDETLPYVLATSFNGDTITFASSMLSGNIITLTSTLTIAKNLTIIGQGAANTVISGNHAVEDIHVNAGVTAGISSVTIENGKIDGSGGGITNLGSLALSNATITGNTAAAPGTTGGGIFNQSGGTLTLSNSVVSDNSCEYAAGIGNQGSMTVINSTISQNTTAESGAGIYNYGGTLTVTGSTISGNLASGGGFGGGVVNLNNGPTVARVTLTDDTIYGNSAVGSGGGVDNIGGTLTLANDTIVDNTGREGGGIASTSSQSTTIVTTIVNTIVAGNSATLVDQDASGTFTANNDLIGNSIGATLNGTANIANPTFLGLSSLGSYGGATQTIALLPGSPAIDTGSNSYVTTSTDQRGDTRIVNGTVDIGAFESQGFVIAIVSGNNQSTTVGTSFKPIIVSVTANNAAEPVNGGQITFAVTPAAGGGSGTSTSPTTISSGQAGVIPIANVTGGTWTATASATGANSVTFTEKNTPTVTTSSVNLPPNAVSLTIVGSGFSTIASHDSVSFDHGVSGSVTSVTGTSLTVSLTGLSNLVAGTGLHALVTVDSASSGSAQVAMITPVVIYSSGILPVTASRLTISGYGFDPTAANDIVSFSNGVTGSVVSATSSLLTVSLTGLGSLTVGTALTASAAVDGVSSGNSVSVAEVVPAVTPSTAGLLNTVTTLTIAGAGFDVNTANDSVSFSNGVTGTVTGATSTSVTVSNLSGLGSLANTTVLNAVVTVDEVSSTSTAVATVQASFGIDSVTATPDGFVLIFNGPIDPNTPVLYRTAGDTTLGPPDVIVIGPNGHTLRGSLVIDATNPDMATFLQTSGLLAAGSYNVTVTNAVQAVGGTEMTGNYTTSLTVASTTSPVLSAPNFARGPGQSVTFSDGQGGTTGIPLTIANVTNLSQASFTLTYDPTLLTIASSGALTLSSAATSVGLAISSYTITNVDAHHSILSVTLSGGTGLTASSAEALLTITASVPDTAGYLDKSVLNLSSVQVNFAAAVGVSGVDLDAYLGDVLGTGLPNAADASLVDQVGCGAGSGFSVFKDVDPSIIAGVNGGLYVNATDASLINEAASGATVAQIPAVPTLPPGVSLTFGGPDPYLYLSAVQAGPGQTVTETLYLDVTDPNGIQLTALDEAIGFDTGELQVSNVRMASGLAGLGSYATASTVDNDTGVLLVGQAFEGVGLPPMVPYGNDIPVLQFDVALNANAAVGSVAALTLLQDGTVNGQMKYTAISDNEGALTWTAGMAPSNSGNAAIDGSVTVVPATASAASEVVMPAMQRPEVSSTKVVERVRRMTPVTAVSQSEPTTVAPGTSVILAEPSASAEIPLAAAETVVANVSLPSQSPVVLVQPESTAMSNPVTVLPGLAPEVVPIASVAPSPVRNVDSGASLSVATLGTNKGIAVTPLGTSSAKTSTSVIDEMYHQLNFLGTLPVNGINPGVGGDDSTEEWLDVLGLESLLADAEARKNSDD